jgi:hypothetical protein
MTVYKMTAFNTVEQDILRMLNTYWSVLSTHVATLEDVSSTVWTAEDGVSRDLTLYALKRQLNADKTTLENFDASYGAWFSVEYGPIYYEQLQGLIESLGNIVTHINSLVTSNYWDSASGKATVSEISQDDRDQLASDMNDELSASQIPNVPIHDITAAGGIGITGDYMKVRGDGEAVTITATPSIEAAQTDGTVIILQGASNSNTLTIQDESNLSGSSVELEGGANVTLGLGDTLMLVYNKNTSKYYQLTKSDV